MKIKKMKKEELEQSSYADITYYLFKRKNKPKTTAELFKEIIKISELPEKTYEQQIGDYYTALTTDKRFVLLKNGKWDLRSNHSSDHFMAAIEDDEEEGNEDIELEEPGETGSGEFSDTMDDEEELVDNEKEILENFEIVKEDFEA